MGRQKGYHHTEETIKTISKNRSNIPAWNKGTAKPKIKKGYHPWNKGKENMHLKGDKNPNWKNGITSLNRMIRQCFKMRQWRCDIFQRDNYTCVNCGVRNGNGK